MNRIRQWALANKKVAPPRQKLKPEEQLAKLAPHIIRDLLAGDEKDPRDYNRVVGHAEDSTHIFTLLTTGHRRRGGGGLYVLKGGVILACAENATLLLGYMDDAAVDELLAELQLTDEQLQEKISGMMSGDKLLGR